MLVHIDSFTLALLRQSIRHFRWVTKTTQDKNYIVFNLETPDEELRVNKDGEGNYTFFYTKDDKIKSEICNEKDLTLKKLHSLLGFLIIL